jgi:hypothetical protein
MLSSSCFATWPRSGLARTAFHRLDQVAGRLQRDCGRFLLPPRRASASAARSLPPPFRGGTPGTFRLELLAQLGPRSIRSGPTWTRPSPRSATCPLGLPKKPPRSTRIGSTARHRPVRYAPVRNRPIHRANLRPCGRVIPRYPEGCYSWYTTLQTALITSAHRKRASVDMRLYRSEWHREIGSPSENEIHIRMLRVQLITLPRVPIILLAAQPS